MTDLLARAQEALSAFVDNKSMTESDCETAAESWEQSREAIWLLQPVENVELELMRRPFDLHEQTECLTQPVDGLDHFSMFMTNTTNDTNASILKSDNQRTYTSQLASSTIDDALLPDAPSTDARLPDAPLPDASIGDWKITESTFEEITELLIRIIRACMPLVIIVSTSHISLRTRLRVTYDQIANKS